MGISIEERDDAIADFARTISKLDLKDVLHDPSLSAVQTHCIENVFSEIETNGGSIQYG